MYAILLLIYIYIIFPLRTSNFADHGYHGSARKAPTCQRSSPRTRPCTSWRSSLEKSRPKRIDPSTTRGDGWNRVKPWVKSWVKPW